MDAAGQSAPQDQTQAMHMQRFCPENVAHNTKQLYYIRSVVSSVAGSTAGVLGLVNLHGFYFYVFCTIVTNVAIYVVNVRTRPRRYLIKFNPTPVVVNASHKASVSGTRPILTFVGFLADGLQEMAFGFVLWWTLWTALIHVYD